jgi:hypothetical protein
MPRNNNIQFRKGTAQTWANTNPVLASGEPGFDVNNYILKIGNGLSHWNDLLPIGGGDLNVLAQEPNGFVNTTSSNLSVDFGNVNTIGSGLFTLSVADGEDSFDVFIRGIKNSFTTNLSVYIPDSTDLYFIYIDKDTKTLKAKNTNMDHDTDISVSYVYWNTDNNQVVYEAEERHGIKMDSATHYYLHRVFGAQYISGLGLSFNSLIGNGSTDVDAKISISDGVIFDEDDEIRIKNAPDPNNINRNNYEQILSPTATIPVFYKEGADGHWKYSVSASYPLKVGTSAQYNQYTGSTWTTTNAGNAKFIGVWLVATNNLLYPIIGIMGQLASDNIGQADTDNLWESLDLSDLPLVEMRPLYRLIFETDGRWTGNASRSALRDVKDIRSILNVTGGSLSPSDHGNLFGLLDDDHPQYVSIDNSRNIDAIHNFTNGLLINNIPAPSGSGSANYIPKWINSSGLNNSLIYDNGTNIGIGTTTPSGKLHVNGSGIFNSGLYISDTANGSYINGSNQVMDFFVNNNRGMRLSQYGSLAINRGTGSALGYLHVNGNGSNPNNTSDPLIVESTVGSGSIIRFKDSFSNDWSIGVNPNGAIQTGSTSGNFAITKISSGVGTSYLTINNSGNIGIGTNSQTYKLEVNGSFGAKTKSFKIDHPSKEGYSLEYGSLESPYHGVRLTGRGKIVKGVGIVKLPDYLKDLIHDDGSLTIQLTNYKHGKTLYVSDIDLQNDKFIVKADRAKTLGELEFFWSLTGTRKDVENLVVEKRN